MRGNFVIVSLQGDYGKPRPALIIQSDNHSVHASVTILPVTSHLISASLFRISVFPDDRNGLKKESQIMIDKTATVKKEKVGAIIGTASDQVMREVGRYLAVFLGIAR
jgi:mRNA interferase MazF